MMVGDAKPERFIGATVSEAKEALRRLSSDPFVARVEIDWNEGSSGRRETYYLARGSTCGFLTKIPKSQFHHVTVRSRRHRRVRCRRNCRYRGQWTRAQGPYPQEDGPISEIAGSNLGRVDRELRDRGMGDRLRNRACGFLARGAGINQSAVGGRGCRRRHRRPPDEADRRNPRGAGAAPGAKSSNASRCAISPSSTGWRVSGCSGIRGGAGCDGPRQAQMLDTARRRYGSTDCPVRRMQAAGLQPTITYEVVRPT